MNQEKKSVNWTKVVGILAIVAGVVMQFLAESSLASLDTSSNIEV